MSKATQMIVAKKAGVSVATVSRVIHNDPAVRPETREQVLRVCEALDYKPSVAARHLSQGAKAVVGLSLGTQDFVVSPYVALMHQALSAELAASSWSVQLIAPADFSSELQVGGLILLGAINDDSRYDACRKKKIPTVSIGHGLPGFSAAPDDEEGGRIAARHLISRGRRRLAALAMPGPDGVAAKRIEAFRDECTVLGSSVELIEVAVTSNPTLQGYRTITRACAAGTRFDGLFCQTDELALGAIAALEDAGRRVPDDVAVVGFDDLPSLATGMTTIRQDVGAIARAAIDLLGEAKRGMPPRRVLLPVTLVRRQTT